MTGDFDKKSSGQDGADSSGISEAAFDAAIKLALTGISDPDDDSDSEAGEHQFSRAFEKRMRSILAGGEKLSAGRKFARALKYAAVAVMICCTVFCAACAMIPTIRAQVWGVVTRFFDEYIEFSYDGGINAGELIEPFAPSYVTDGFRLVDELVSGFHVSKFYEDADGRYISYSQSTLGGSTMVNNEGAVVSNVTVNGLEGIRVSYPAEEGQEACEFVMWGDDKCEWSLLGYVSYDELIKIAGSLVKLDSFDEDSSDNPAFDASALEPLPEFERPEESEVTMFKRSDCQGRVTLLCGPEQHILDVTKDRSRTLERPSIREDMTLTEVEINGHSGYMTYYGYDYGGETLNYQASVSWFDGEYLCEVEYSAPVDDGGEYAISIAKTLK